MKSSQFSTPNSQLSKAFGLLEVLISTGILVMIMGAAIFAGRMAIRNNIIANQRAQAYNLVRQDLENIRVVRDSTWIDQSVNNWYEPFKNFINDGQPHSITFEDGEFVFDKQYIQDISLDQTKFTREIYFNSVTDYDFNTELRKLANSNNINTNDVKSIIITKVVVSWNSYGQKYSVTGAVNLSDWKPQN